MNRTAIRFSRISQRKKGRARKAGFANGANIEGHAKADKTEEDPNVSRKAWHFLHDHGPGLAAREGEAARQQGEGEREPWGASVYLRGQRRQAARYGGAVEKHDENGVATTGGRTQANPDAAQGVAEPGHSDATSRTTSILSPWLRQVLVFSVCPSSSSSRCVTDRTYVAPEASE